MKKANKGTGNMETSVKRKIQKSLMLMNNLDFIFIHGQFSCKVGQVLKIKVSSAEIRWCIKEEPAIYMQIKYTLSS